MGTPSITYNGSFPAVIEPTPRTRTDNPAPGEPDVCCTRTPANFPVKIWSILFTGTFLISFADKINKKERRSRKS